MVKRQPPTAEKAFKPLDRKSRIRKLIQVGWIKSAEDIPADVIPVDPDRLNTGNSPYHPIFYQDIEFTCCDCGVPQCWRAADQQWYYETTSAPFYATAIRCRPCRQKEQLRKAQARASAGHAPVNLDRGSR